MSHKIYEHILLRQKKRHGWGAQLIVRKNQIQSSQCSVLGDRWIVICIIDDMLGMILRNMVNYNKATKRGDLFWYCDNLKRNTNNSREYKSHYRLVWQDQTNISSTKTGPIKIVYDTFSCRKLQSRSLNEDYSCDLINYSVTFTLGGWMLGMILLGIVLSIKLWRWW